MNPNPDQSLTALREKRKRFALFAATLRQGSIQGSNLNVSQSNSEELRAPEMNSSDLSAPGIGW
jgi:hypothetical protein